MAQITKPTPHYGKLTAAIANPKCADDQPLLYKAVEVYKEWTSNLQHLSSNGEQLVKAMVELLNWYKNELEVELIMKNGSDFLKRQKGQLKLDNSILEEFFIHLVHPSVLEGLENLDRLNIGPQNAFMSLAFLPRSFAELGQQPNVVVKTKDQDFVIGTRIFYRFSSDKDFGTTSTVEGDLTLAVLAAECKVNLDKTMFQEAAGTAARLKQGCPASKYFLLVEYLDMEPEDCRLTAIDNVFLLRHDHRLPFEKRNVIEEVLNQHKTHPIDAKLIWKFVQEMQYFIKSQWYEPERALERGTFV